MTQREELLVDSGMMYALTRDEDSTLYLEVMCGGIAMEWCIVRLTTDEISGYEQSGKEFLDSLAGEIVRNQSKFAARTLK